MEGPVLVSLPDLVAAALVGVPVLYRDDLVGVCQRVEAYEDEHSGEHCYELVSPDPKLVMWLHRWDEDDVTHKQWPTYRHLVLRCEGEWQLIKYAHSPSREQRGLAWGLLGQEMESIDLSKFAAKGWGTDE